MKVQRYLKNIRSENGVTTADIVVAATIVALTIAIVSMIYVNAVYANRNVSRTAGATRIATNILENIEKLSYEDFVKTYESQVVAVGTKISDATHQYNDYYSISGGNNVKIFSTSVPKGYTIYAIANNNYGTYATTSEQFDLVRDIKIIVSFEVGDTVENIDFQTVKTREIVDDVNKPNTDYLTSAAILTNSIPYYYPVKYLESSNAYIKTDKDDNEWYNYENKKWATIIVSKKTENEIFDANGKFIGTINTDKNSEDYTEKFAWIPRFFTKTADNTFYAFAYSGTGNMQIVSDTLTAVDTDSTLLIKTTSAIDTAANGHADAPDFESKTGIWVSFKDISTIVHSKILNESKYGPFDTH